MQTENNTYVHKHQTQILKKELVLSILLMLKEHIRLGYDGILIYYSQRERKKKKRLKERQGR